MEILPRAILDEIHAARARRTARAGRMHVEAGGARWRVLRKWRGGIALDPQGLRHLRGCVDLYEGETPLAQLLIVASRVEGDELLCTVKRETCVRAAPPADFEAPAPFASRGLGAFAGLLPRL